MIIINSQDGKSIEKCETINMEEERECRGMASGPLTGDWLIRGDCEVLATYPTEERAKEVMDMIEEHIRKLYTTKHCAMMINYSSDLFIPSEKFMEEAIFTMPKE